MVTGLLTGTSAGLGYSPLRSSQVAVGSEGNKPQLAKLTDFQIACMTLPYRQFPLQRALEGIKNAGFHYVAWGTKHVEQLGDKPTPLIAWDASPQKARELARRCRDLGLEPVMMFSTVFPEEDDATLMLTSRIKQAAASGIRQVLTFGHTDGGNHQIWVKRLKQIAPIAGDHNVVVVIKQHGGATGSGQACAELVRQIDNPHVRINYDAGNVMDYLNVDPIPDIQQCAHYVRSFCIKDHRNWPNDQDCGPGYGQIDHYKLLHPVSFTGRELPLCCENVFAPMLPRPVFPGKIDELARRARKYLETVVQGLQSAPA